MYEFYLDNTTGTNSAGSVTWGTTTYSYYCSKCSTWYWDIYSHTCCPHSCSCGCKTTGGVTVVYKYQITCPKCETKMWGEIDETVKCTKCKSKIHVKLAEKKDHDYEVEV